VKLHAVEVLLLTASTLILLAGILLPTARLSPALILLRGARLALLRLWTGSDPHSHDTGGSQHRYQPNHTRQRTRNRRHRWLLAL
jgi:hypothetical protein